MRNSYSNAQIITKSDTPQEKSIFADVVVGEYFECNEDIYIKIGGKFGTNNCFSVSKSILWNFEDEMEIKEIDTELIWSYTKN